VNFSGQPNQQILYAQAPHSTMGAGLGAQQMLPTGGGATLSYSMTSMPGTRMATISDSSQAPKYIYKQDRADAAFA